MYSTFLFKVGGEGLSHLFLSSFFYLSFLLVTQHLRGSRRSRLFSLLPTTVFALGGIFIAGTLVEPFFPLVDSLALKFAYPRYYYGGQYQIPGRTYGTHNNLPWYIYFAIFTNNIWFYLLWSPVIIGVLSSGG